MQTFSCAITADMGPGTSTQQQDKVLSDIIADKRLHCDDAEFDIQICDLVAFGMNEESLSAALARAHKKKQLNILYRTSIEDLCCEDHVGRSPVIARVRVVKAQSLQVPPDATHVGDFAYTENGVGDVSLYWRSVPIQFGPKADKVIALLLKSTGQWKNKEQISSATDATAQGVSEMIRSINGKVSLKTQGSLLALIERDQKGRYRIDT